MKGFNKYFLIPNMCLKRFQLIVDQGIFAETNVRGWRLLFWLAKSDFCCCANTLQVITFNNVGDPVLTPGLEDPLEKGKATHPSILAWRIPWTV